MLKLDKEKYARIARNEGYEAAITQLHKDQTSYEFETFEGEKGYQPEMWKDLEEVRQLSRELWEISTQKAV